MEKCLLTKLKGNVDNNSLLKMGEMRARAHVTDEKQAFSAYYVSGTLSENAGAYIINDTGNNEFQKTNGKSIGKNVGNCAPNTVVRTSGVYDIIIKNKYELEICQIPGCEIDLSEFKYCTQLKEILIQGSFATGHLSDVSSILSTLRQFRAPFTTVSGDVSVFSNNTTFYELWVNNVHSITGNINAFNNSLVLNRLHIEGTQISGSLDTLANAHVSRGRTTGSIQVYGNGIITFKSNGDGTGSDTIISNNTIKTITFNDGGYNIA